MHEADVRDLCTSGMYGSKKISGTLVTTHISWVILGSRFAFKIKKPIKLPFLDFSTLAKRKAFCKKEVLLNSRFSDIYLGVVPICNKKRGWNIGDCAGKASDYAVLMKRMNPQKRMDALLKSGKVSDTQIGRLAGLVAGFHQRAQVIDTPFSIRSQRKAFNDLQTIRPFVGLHLGKTYTRILERSVHWSNNVLLAYGGCFRNRVRKGYQRDVHGDLHSGNVFLYSRPVIFDCIEFNDSYRQIDIMDEVAFLCMDLEARGKKRLSKSFFREYVRQYPLFDSTDDKMLFRYYKCYRANVRAKVHAIAAEQTREPDARNYNLQKVKRYLLLIGRYID